MDDLDTELLLSRIINYFIHSAIYHHCTCLCMDMIHLRPPPLPYSPPTHTTMPCGLGEQTVALVLGEQS